MIVGLNHRAREEGMERGIEQGIERGRRQGRVEGVRQGRVEGVRQGRAEGVRQGRAEGVRQGRAEGVRQGRAEGERAVLARLLRRRFGTLPPRVGARLGGASEADLESWADRVLDAATLDDVFDTERG